MADLLVELFSEEIPARMQIAAAGQLQALLVKALGERSIAVADGAAQAFSTPRRIGLTVSGLPSEEPRRTVRRRGPRVDAPAQALEGFHRSLAGVPHRLETVEEKKGTFHLAVLEEGGTPIDVVVQGVLEELLPRFPWPKSMRWGDGEARWVRPLQRILCLIDGRPVPVSFAGLVGAAETSGHRFMAPTTFTVTDAEEHERQLAEAKVIRDPERRRTLIEERARALAEAEGLTVRPDAALLTELSGLTEWPVPLLGRIDPEFMHLPAEVLTTSMRTHQKYLSLADAAGALAPRFVLVANLEAPDDGAAIVAGNERVLRARLWDAKFFWDSDLAARLESREHALERMVFHARLGSMAAKSGRLAALAATLAEQLGLGEATLAARAGLLAKADLVTGMVGEFPELQGVMGGYYARQQGEAEPVVAAISGHYAPQGPQDACPSAPVTVAVALADKLDSLVGFFAVGERATGSGDPLGLRRLALGILRLVLTNGLRLRLHGALEQAFDGYGDALAAVDRGAVLTELRQFILERLKIALRDEGVRPDVIAAVFQASDDDDPLRLRERVRAVETFLHSADGGNLLAAHRRARNIVRIESKKDGVPVAGTVDEAVLQDAAERDLHMAMGVALPAMQSALQEERFTDAMAGLASLRLPVDRFFEEVLVNAEEPALRANRLRLLAALGGVLDEVAAFDLLEEPRVSGASG